MTTRTPFVLALILAVAGATAQAQSCGGATDVEGAHKFSLIARHCGVALAPAAGRSAAQLDLYDRPSHTITLSAEPAAPAGGAQAARTLPAAPTQLPEPAPMRTPYRSDVPLPKAAERVITVAPILTDAARAHRIDPLLMHAVAHVESRHNAEAVSHAGARGLMQVMPATARRFGVGDAERTLMDPGTNAFASAALLRTLVDRYPGDLALVLAAYNAGEGAVERHGRRVPPYAETQRYVRDVTAIYRRLQAEFSVMPNGAIVARSPAL